MNKGIAVSVAILATGFILFNANRTFEAEKKTVADTGETIVIPSFSFPVLEIPTARTGNKALASGAWAVFETYLEFARNHDMEGVRSLSHQISDTCNDSAKQEACFALMDSVYFFGSQLEFSEFTHIEVDERQIIMYTEGPEFKILYFTRTEIGTPKVLGLRLCTEEEDAPDPGCAETNASTTDQDSDGWWDSVESLFQPNTTQ
ncbi:MAG: hypothetical protein CO183_00855 [Candidatus Zambryskibacteria bacterium CG_4_9_14_3_um_filter_42_9]|uniref:Uncharacterized protein n=1 Tax=Candidatus Zambryskibacteria bacterium CG22_combo_CG10-13_8_21_14_all_42_17 TaxID=1975118 RepID=A0A2H0BCU9_9BACT|nr:MAG: hypothetical protein COX06_02830 [Candidatus Zambryskibacteria bacterium CG22_combo_CG10-13_8_21_14_all_42_17]PJA36933.1 MAG: hypothetical protein CO183_00855 [Candidatus Zambryskibacteria bacterium CG_4_9_14_3_um_filter_42_9]